MVLIDSSRDRGLRNDLRGRFNIRVDLLCVARAISRLNRALLSSC